MSFLSLPVEFWDGKYALPHLAANTLLFGCPVWQLSPCSAWDRAQGLWHAEQALWPLHCTLGLFDHTQGISVGLSPEHCEPAVLPVAVFSEPVWSDCSVRMMGAGVTGTRPDQIKGCGYCQSEGQSQGSVVTQK